MSTYTLNTPKLREGLEKLFEGLQNKGMIDPRLSLDKKEQLIENMAQALEEVYKDAVPQDIFTDKNLRHIIFSALIAAAIQEKNPNVKFNFAPLFKKLKELHEMEPDDPLRKEKQKEIAELMENIAEESKQLNNTPELKKAAGILDKLLEMTFINLFGVTPAGQPVIIQEQQGDPTGTRRDNPQYAGMEGIANLGRNANMTMDPSTRARDEQLDEDVGILSEAVLKELIQAKILHEAKIPKLDIHT